MATIVLQVPDETLVSKVKHGRVTEYDSVEDLFQKLCISL